MSTITNWDAVAATDPTLAAYVQRQVAMAVVDLAHARAEAAHWERTAHHLREQLDTVSTRDVRAVNRQRQRRWRQRHQALIPTEGPQ